MFVEIILIHLKKHGHSFSYVTNKQKQRDKCVLFCFADEEELDREIELDETIL